MGREKAVENYDVVIIGGGPAGLSAAIYAGRARLKTLLLEKALVGGLATYTNEIANYPGFPDNPKGETITDLMKNQAKNLGVTFKLTAVTSVDLKGEEKVVETFRNKFLAKVIIIATGGRPRTTGGKNEENYLFDKGISFCATCDAASNTGKHVVVIGSGDAAIEEGMFLTKFASKVTVSVMHEEGKMDCNEIAKAAALANPKMAFVWNTVVDGFEGDGHLKTVILRNVKTGELIPVDCDNCFEFIGYLPNSELFENQLPLTSQKYITVNNKMETGIEGVLAVGDITDKYLKQIATAVGDGAVAGTVAERYIAEKNIFDNQIMQKEKTGLIFVYNAIDCDARNFLAEVEAIEKSANGSLAVSRIDTYKSNGLALKLELESVPAAVVTKEGKIVQKIYGLNKDAILEAL
ncbi:FAD-dependent oxidoreductase [Youngiibacter fragilis]|uniref:FAD-dependent pyridine nucleotide-disulfide oxidoreductase n=1 Tax=Youngiibacter fragilis 232.1 TaxID=994573 RepID=V7I8R3_9CLOT|nr:FAD-dependent oxidoreductase [Youngiibacter fragilis]ETA82253.1 FAD-dependent pyridine nucleotide-disulfide oxidoreductase [Youngiibacter fragilis 232.1]